MSSTNTDTIPEWICGIFGLIAGICIGVFIGLEIMKNKATELDYGGYDNKTGEWAWVIPEGKNE